MKHLILTSVTSFALLSAGTVLACPFCSAPSLTLSEQVSQSDATALVQWVEGKPADRDAGEIGSTTYEVVNIVQNAEQGLDKGDRITLDRYRSARVGDLFLLTGTQGTGVEWGSPLEVSETSYGYISQAPSPEAPIEERLDYFIKFLEYPDDLIANDAYAEFAKAPYDDIAPMKDKFPREKIRKWINDPNTPPTRLGLYGLMLGLSGNEDDARMMADKIFEPSDEFRLGIDGIIWGYLLITGEEGLARVEKEKFENKDIPFSETYAAMQALRVQWTYGGDKISKDRLRQSMRLLLDRPTLADLVIADLARWEDWSIMDRLMKMYDEEVFDVPSIKRAIVRYMLVASRADKDDQSDESVATAKAAESHLASLKEKDPALYKQAERFFLID